MLNGLNILVTGGAGFIGSNIVEFLLKNTKVRYVRVIDNLSTGKRENIEQFLSDNRFMFIEGDITDFTTVKNVMQGIDIVCHQAALGSVPRSIGDPLNSHNSNVNGFINVLQCAVECDVKRVVYATSSSVYGDNMALPKIEDTIGNPLSPYAVTKRINELYANIYYKCYGLETIGLRYFNVFGPRQDPNGAYAAVIPKFILKILNGERPIINGNGEYSRDFTYVSNVVDANILAMSIKNTKAYGEIFNIGFGGRITLNGLIESLQKIFSKKIDPNYRKSTSRRYISF